MVSFYQFLILATVRVRGMRKASFPLRRPQRQFSPLKGGKVSYVQKQKKFQRGPICLVGNININDLEGWQYLDAQQQSWSDHFLTWESGKQNWEWRCRYLTLKCEPLVFSKTSEIHILEIVELLFSLHSSCWILKFILLSKWW